MTTINNVALAGATGNLGPAILSALTKAGFNVTVLTRTGSKSNMNFDAGIKTVQVDYDSKESVTRALQGHDAFISTIGHQTPEQQANLIDASIAAGKLPFYGPKIAHQKDVQAEVQGTSTTYTFLMAGPFLDWCLGAGIFADLKNRKVNLWDGGGVKISTTPLDKIGQAVIGVLRHPAETANKVVRVLDMVVTQKKILEAAKKVLGPDGWETPARSTADRLAKSWEAFKANPEDHRAGVFGFLFRAVFSEECKPAFTEVDNELLGWR